MSSLNFPETVESEFEADYWPPDRRASACSLPCHVAIPSSELNLEFPNDVYSVAGARKVCAFWTHLDEALGKEEAREMFDLTTARYTVRDDDVCARCIPDCVVTENAPSPPSPPIPATCNELLQEVIQSLYIPNPTVRLNQCYGPSQCDKGLIKQISNKKQWEKKETSNKKQSENKKENEETSNVKQFEKTSNKKCVQASNLKQPEITSNSNLKQAQETSNKRQCVRNCYKKISERTSNKNQNEKSFNREPFGNGKLKKDDIKWVEDELNRFEIQNNARREIA
ncbi:hypothetical protein M8J77_011415 [Diaphorina citri]|nr:hypothetical protein M8J77_011415 [Diaphorina citri]